tara:strand:- start:385 stop:600 length:216 start_codon:yes stop_codon:yes gene_type:complete
LTLNSINAIVHVLESRAMNGRIDKVAMTSRVNHMINGLHSKQWYPEWRPAERKAAKRILLNVLEVLDEYHS